MLSENLKPLERDRKKFGGSALFGAAPVTQDKNKREGAPQISN